MEKWFLRGVLGSSRVLTGAAVLISILSMEDLSYGKEGLCCQGLCSQDRARTAVWVLGNVLGGRCSGSGRGQTVGQGALYSPG